MNVHLIVDTIEGDQVLARFARILVESLGWTYGSHPQPDAELNYFFPYLMATDFLDFKDTPTAGWFTHHDTYHSARKADLWYDIARVLSLRLTCAEQYADDLRRFGPTAIVIPPIDLPRDSAFFRLREHVSPVIGVSGMVYSGGRKGERLVVKLAEVAQRNGWTIKAAGRGWPVPTQYYRWSDMATFYAGLDVYVCTSLVEGIPMPPLEALACGTPIVIPRGVGLLDSLPDMVGIDHYEAGNFGSMITAIENSLRNAREGGKIDCSRATRPFTIAAWANSHVTALEPLLRPSHPAFEVIDNPLWGVYYVAYGEPALRCVERAVASMKHYMPQVSIALVSDATTIEKLPARLRSLMRTETYICNADEDVGGRSVKTKIYDLTPAEWDYVLYADADTEVVGDITFLWRALDSFELVFTYNPPRYVLLGDGVRPDNKPEMEETIELIGTSDVLQLNGGVFAFRRCEPIRRLMARWHEEWLKWGKRDQAALTRALYTNPVRLLVLGNEWNTVTRYVDPARTAGILHYPLEARRWGPGILRGRLDSPEAWAAIHPETPPQRGGDRLARDNDDDE